MGVYTTSSTMPGALTPICNDCGIALCWDISEEEYSEAVEFWENWICQDCNHGVRQSLKEWKAKHNV